MKTRRKKKAAIHLADGQVRHISDLIHSALLSGGRSPEFAECLRELQAEIDTAKVVPQDRLPLDVVRIGSYVEVEDLSDGYADQFQLVYPEYSDLAMGRISLLTPMGIALLGRAQGETVEYKAPSGSHRIRIKQVASELLEGMPSPETLQRPEVDAE
jgi:regulator of nucleoside diphosphate kinase